MRISTTVIALAFPISAVAHQHKAEHTHRGTGIIWHDQDRPMGKFTATGRICAGPAIDDYGDMVTSYANEAKRKADQEASRQCYPFQSRRESEYSYKKENEECKSTDPYAIHETVTAEYICAPFEVF